MQPVPQRLSRTSQPVISRTEQRPKRKAFSLIELMIVIAIIAILMSLLLVGVQAARKTARVATVTVEFKQIEKAIADFKAKFGAEPPSGISLFEDDVDWTPPTYPSPTPLQAAVSARASRSRALIRQIWPDFNFALDRDINDDGDMSDTITLSGAECLVFFLGGVPDQTGNPNTPWGLLGFSTNPENPFALGGARNGPYHEFNVGRLRNLEGTADTELMPEYLDSLPGQTNPILYASSYGGKGYRDSDLWLISPALPVPTAYNRYDEYVTPPTGFAWFYRRYSGTTFPIPAVDPAGPPVIEIFSTREAFNPKSCQLISPGIDGEYGWGGVLDTDMQMHEPRAERYFERDNITNFKGGTLN